MSDETAALLGRLANHVENIALGFHHPDNDEYDRGFIAGMLYAVQMIVEFDVDRA